MKRLLFVAVAVGAMACLGQMARAQLPIVFDEGTYPTNPENTFGAFTFDDFSAAGAFTDGASSLTLNVTDTNGSNGVFGGVGVDYGTPPGTNNHNFDPALAQWEINIKVLPNNAATAFRTTYIDQDPGFPVPAEEYVYEFDLTGVPADGQCYLRERNSVKVGALHARPLVPERLPNATRSSVRPRAGAGWEITARFRASSMICTPLGSSLPSPTRTRVPTRVRTIWWRKALARKPNVTTAPSRTTDTRCRSRTVDRPDPGCRQNEAKSCTPTTSRAAARIRTTDSSPGR